MSFSFARSVISLFVVLSSSAFVTNCASSPRSGSGPQNPHTQATLEYEKDLYFKQSFVSHRSPTSQKQSSSYLAMNLDHKAFSRLRESLESLLDQKLIHRDESHITVITPPEFAKILSKHLKMSDIDALAAQAKIQEIVFKPTCIGRGTATIDGKEEQTYYVVIHSEGLFELRRKILEAFVKKGGNRDLFNPDFFYPHITLGFTKRDLHHEDGVIKDERSCAYALTEKK